VTLAYSSAGIVVAVLPRLALGVGELGEAAVGVIGVNDGLIEGAGFFGLEVSSVVLEAVCLVLRVFEGDQVIAVVIGVFGDATGRVGDPGQTVEGVVGVAGGFIFFVGGGDAVAVTPLSLRARKTVAA
jgi:hypothetical protein